MGYRIAHLSPRISNPGLAQHIVPESFENRPRFPFFFPFDQSLDRALNHNIRLLSEPDRKFSLEKGGGIRAEHLVTRERSLRELSWKLTPKRIPRNKWSHGFCQPRRENGINQQRLVLAIVESSGPEPGQGSLSSGPASSRL